MLVGGDGAALAEENLKAVVGPAPRWDLRHLDRNRAEECEPALEPLDRGECGPAGLPAFAASPGEPIGEGTCDF